MDTLFEVCQFAQATFQNIFLVNTYLENGIIRPKVYMRTGFIAHPNFAYFIFRFALVIGLLKYFAITVHSYMQGSAQCVYAAYAHTMQAAGYFIGIFIKLTAG